MATNTTKRTIIFTVDKTSPKIEFVEAIDGNYFTEAIIPELLISDLSEYTIVSQTLNGKAYELGDEILILLYHINFVNFITYRKLYSFIDCVEI